MSIIIIGMRTLRKSNFCDRVDYEIFKIIFLIQKLEKQQQPSSFQPKAPTTGRNDPVNPSGPSNTQQKSNDPFEHYDVVETSLHFNIKRLDIHIIADSEILSTSKSFLKLKTKYKNHHLLKPKNLFYFFFLRNSASIPE